MATTTKGRYSSSRSRPNYNSFAGFSWGGASPSTYGGTTHSSKKKSTSSRSTSRKTTAGSPTAYKACYQTFEQRIQSYKTLCTQAQGTGTWGRPSPATLNSFANWINKGAVVHTVSPQQVARWARAAHKAFNPSNPTPTACKAVLTKKFGKSAIKAVARCKNGTFMVATTQSVNGRSFNFPR